MNHSRLNCWEVQSTQHQHTTSETRTHKHNLKPNDSKRRNEWSDRFCADWMCTRRLAAETQTDSEVWVQLEAWRDGRWQEHKLWLHMIRTHTHTHLFNSLSENITIRRRFGHHGATKTSKFCQTPLTRTHEDDRQEESSPEVWMWRDEKRFFRSLLTWRLKPPAVTRWWMRCLQNAPQWSLLKLHLTDKTEGIYLRHLLIYEERKLHLVSPQTPEREECWEKNCLPS